MLQAFRYSSKMCFNALATMGARPISTAMDTNQFSRYLEHLSVPRQLTLGPDEKTLYFLYQRHMTRFIFSNMSLYMNEPPPDLTVEGLLNSMPSKGGLCIQHAELMHTALEHLGFDVTRVAGRVLDGETYREDMTLDHIFLLVKIQGENYLVDPGLASATPMFPVNLGDMTVGKEVTVTKGDTYKFEVDEYHYNVYWRIKNDWFSLFRFPRDKTTGWAIPADHNKSKELMLAGFAAEEFILSRDGYVMISGQTHDSKYYFKFMEGEYAFKMFHQGQLSEIKKGLDYKAFFELVNNRCKLNLEPLELPHNCLRLMWFNI